MKSLILIFKTFVVCLLTTVVFLSRVTAKDLSESFLRPSVESQPWCYWYWMSGNVTKEGIIADLDGFARVGVGGVYIMDIGGKLPAGDVKYRSPQWKELFTLAVSEASKRNIKTAFHCPGWSASGGPWITPELGMQEIVWSESVVEGGKEFSDHLPAPPSKLDYYRDIAVVAFPTLPDDKPLPEPMYVTLDGKTIPTNKNGTQFPAEFDIVYPEKVTARSIYIRSPIWNNFDSTLSYWNESEGAFKKLTRCIHTNTNPFSDKVGAASFDAVQTTKFRIKFHHSPNPSMITILISGGSRLSRWTDKAGYANAKDEKDDDGFNALRPDEAREKSGSAIPVDQIIDLSNKMDANGKLFWTPPSGTWTILRFGHRPTGIHIEPPPIGGDGLECDKLSVEAVNFHYDQCVTPILKMIGPELHKKTMAFYHVDSYEASWQTWTKEFRNSFKKLRGYDLLPYLPCLTGRMVGNAETSDQFLWDYRRTISDLFVQNHYAQLAKRCAQDGIRFSNEPYTGPFRALDVGAVVDMPMIEFWTSYANPRVKNKLIPCNAGVYAGRTREIQIIGGEAFTSMDAWTNHPYNIKALGDWVYAGGVNRFVLHVSAHQPYLDEHLMPGFTCGGNGTHFDRGNTWWKHGAPEYIGGYLTRCQTLLQQGEPQADFLCFAGDDSPGNHSDYVVPVPIGYDFDLCTTDTLNRLKVKNKQLVLPGGKTYKYLTLPSLNRGVTLSSLKAIHSLASKGAQIFGDIPEASPSLSDARSAKEYTVIAQELNKLKRQEKNINDLLTQDQLPPDFSYDEKKGLILHATHRRVGDKEIYFVANVMEAADKVDCRFRVSGMIPEIWNPETGEITSCAFYQQTDGVTRIPLIFSPSGSMFVVFKPGKSELHVNNVEVLENKSSIRVLKATYRGNKETTLDVTEELNSRIANGLLVVDNFTTLKGDPEPYVAKKLTIEYEYRGKVETLVYKDGEILRLPKESINSRYEIARNNSKLLLRSSVAGEFMVELSNQSRQKVKVDSLPSFIPIQGPWKVNFPKGWGAPEEINFERLISWPEHQDEGVKYFSGTATYTTTINVKEISPKMRMDLGKVEVIAKATINGKPLPVLWKPPFVYDVSGMIRKGNNEIQVEVTNLWPNRMIGDENYPDDCTPNQSWTEHVIPGWPDWLKQGLPRPEPRRLTFATTKHSLKKGHPLYPSGLIGPVVIEPYAEVEISK